MFARLATFVIAHRRAVTALSALAFLVVAGGAAKLRVDFSVLAFFAGDDPEKVHFDAFTARWGTDDDTLLIVAHVDDGDLLAPARVRALDATARRLRTLEMVKSVFSVVDAPLPEPGAPVLDLRPLVERLPDDAGLAAFRAAVLSSKAYVPTLLARDARTAAMVVETTASSDAVTEIQPTVAALREVLAAQGADDGIHYALAGIPAVRSDFFGAFMRDQSLFVPLGMLIIVALLVFLFRSAHGVFIPAAAAMIPVAMTFGVMGYTGEAIGIVNQAYSILLPVIAVADAIHLVSRFHEELGRRRREGQELTRAVRFAAIADALQHVGAACALTSLTTAIGFASLAVARMPSMRTFGLYAAVGIVVAYAVVLFVVPVLLTLVGPTAARTGEPGNETRVGRALAWAGAVSVDHPRVVLLLSVVVTTLFAFASTKTITDNHLTHLLRADHPTSEANVRADRELGGILAFELDLEGPPGALLEPRALTALLSLETLVDEIPELRAVNSLATLVAGVQESLTGTRAIPDTRASVEQLLVLADDGGRLRDMVSSDGRFGRAQIRSIDTGGRAFTDLGERVTRAVAARLASSGLTVHVTGTPFIAYRGINNVTFDLRESLLLAFVVIALIIAVLLRNLRVALLCLLPNALPLLVGYGFLGLTGWLLEPSGAVVFTVALGIAVDDTLHLIVRTREELVRGHPLDDALKIAVAHSGRAVVVTSIILVGGFGVLALSEFPATRLLGALGAVIILTALACDLFVLPALLAVFGRSLGRAR